MPVISNKSTALSIVTKQGLMWLGVLCFVSSAWGETSIRVTPDSFAAGLNTLQRSRGAITMTFAAGDYFLPSPINLSVMFGPVVLAADPGAKVVISNGLPVKNWKQGTFNGHECWVADMPTVRSRGLNFRELWVDGKRATRSRYPAIGYLAAAIPVDDKTPWNVGQTWLGYKPGDIPADLPIADVEAVVMNRWEESRMPLRNIDDAAHRVNTARKSVFQLEDGDPYYLEGSPRWLDHPGEWYLDRQAGTLYYLPRPGEQIATTRGVAPQMASLLTMDHAAKVTFRGLTFSHSEWNFPDPSPMGEPITGGFGQAAVGVPAAVSLSACRDCRFESCVFEHLGNFALELGRGCRGDVIDHCTFTDLGAGAIKIGEQNIRDGVMDQTCRNTVSDCRITDGGHMFASAPGIWVGQSYDNDIEHNEIANFYNAGISIGWTWGYGPSLARGNRVTANLIHDLGRLSNGDGPILSDMGAVYTLGTRAGTVVSGNIFHDIAARVYGGWGLYLDEGSSDLLAQSNLIYRTTHGGFHLHYGKNNVIQNNIFALSREIAIARTTSAADQSLTFQHNLVYWDSGDFTETDPSGLNFDHNIYDCVGKGKLKFGDKSWPQWQAAGQDAHSFLMDPGFKDPAHGDFSMRDGSVVRRIDFEKLDLASVGVRQKE